MTIDKYSTKCEDETIALGNSFAEKLTPGDVVSFFGELGSGKTEFIKGVCEYFDVNEMVNSPTFTIINQYIGEYDRSELKIYHLDLYRIKNNNELTEIGFGECINAGDSIKLIEWAEKAGDSLDSSDFKIFIQPHDDDENLRAIEIHSKN